MVSDLISKLLMRNELFSTQDYGNVWLHVVPRSSGDTALLTRWYLCSQRVRYPKIRWRLRESEPERSWRGRWVQPAGPVAPRHSVPLAACVSLVSCRRRVASLLGLLCWWPHTCDYTDRLWQPQREGKDRGLGQEKDGREKREGGTQKRDEMFYCHISIEGGKSAEVVRKGGKPGNQMQMTGWIFSSRNICL